VKGNREYKGGWNVRPSPLECSSPLLIFSSLFVGSASSPGAGEVVVFSAVVARKVGIVSTTAKVKEAEATKR
jgi:hypothetical protein